MTELKTKKRSSYELPIKTNYLIFKNGRAKWIRTIEMTESKSVALPLGYSPIKMVEGDGFEPSNSERVDLQSTAFSHFATLPFILTDVNWV